MRFNLIRQRLDRLEENKRPSDTTLRFADGSSRAISISRKHVLDVFLDAMYLVWLNLPPEPSAPSSVKTKHDIKHESIVRLIGSAERIESDDKFMALVHSMCVQALGKRAQGCRIAGGCVVHIRHF